LKLRNGDGNVKLEYIPLAGTLLRLQPFAPELKAEVRSAVDCDPDTWAMMPVNPMGDGFDIYWSAACGAPPVERMAYAIRRNSDDRVIGMSTYYTGLLSQGGVEIGTSFLHPSARGGAANPETKLLMLDHAFSCGAVRVQFRVDTRNKRSQAAVAKLGAIKEGVLRRDRLTWTGYIRDTVVFSILDREWPELKARLQKRVESLIEADLTKL
jgi:RimJ/RimL family protein N-acetyltransferase